MLWEMSLTEQSEAHRIIPIFVNENGVLRPVAGKRIMDVFLNPNSKLRVRTIPNVDAEVYEKLEKLSMDNAYDTFVEMREKQLQKNDEDYHKYMYALKLRREAADQIGIENIRLSRLARLDREQERIAKDYQAGQQVYPDFRLMLLAHLEA